MDHDCSAGKVAALAGMLPNSRFVTDPCAAALRAFFGAAQPGR